VLTPSEIEGSGAQDRAGLMRGVPGAGVDVGTLARRGLALALRRNWLSGPAVWLAAGTGALLSIVLRGSVLKPLLWLPFSLGVVVAITALRAAYVTGDADARVRLRWLAGGAMSAAVLFALAGLAGLGESSIGTLSSFVLLTLAPAAFLIGLAVAVLKR
jgi:hypothetical protein